MVCLKKNNREKLKCGKQKLKMCDAKYQSEIRRQKNISRGKKDHRKHIA